MSVELSLNSKKDTTSELPEDNLEELYENAPCGYILTAPDGSMLRVNQTFLNQTGYSRAELLKVVTFQELMTKPGRVFYETHFGPLIRIQGFVKEIACDLLRRDQTKLPVLVNAILVADSTGEPSMLRFTVFDATERRRYEADLLAARRRAEHFKAIVETSADSIISIGADERVQSWNAGAERMFGYTAAEAIGRSVREVVQLREGADDVEATAAALRSGKPVYMADEAKTKDGREIYVTVSLTPHIEPPGELTSVSAIIRDVTERKRVVDAKHRQELLENLLASQESERQRISRDLHDHLGQQLTGLRLALADLKVNNSENLARIESIQDQAVQIDKDLSFLAFELRPTILDEAGLAGALDNFIIEWSKNYKIPAGFHGPAAVSPRLAPTIEINLYRIVQEALNNILKHADADRVSVILDLREAELSLVIEDNGVGFVVDESAEPLRVSGHGLGLKGMRERAAVLDGTLDIESQLNGGTTIFIRVPNVERVD